MIAQNEDNKVVSECKVTATKNGYQLVGTFHADLTIDGPGKELDQIEKAIESVGQQIKRDLCQRTLETADERNAELFRKTQSYLHKNGKPPFTIVTKFGEVTLKRQQLRNAQTGTTMIPSATCQWSRTTFCKSLGSTSLGSRLDKK